MRLTNSDWQRLRDLRKRFLENASENYWNNPRDLELYDLIYAARIGWKWNAVLEDLKNVGWHSQAQQIVDWGCGTAIAARTVALWSGISQVALVDQSPLALAFAQKKLREAGKKIIPEFSWQKEKPTLLLISHVVSELHEKELLELALFATQADEIIWVEPGSHELSRRLISVRKKILQVGHHLIAPCTHEHACPMFEEKQERDWCHFFAKAPAEIFQSSLWHQASRELGIDLRSLPYSYLAFSRKKFLHASTDAERLIGHPRMLKAHGKLFCCGSSGLCERMLQKRDNPELFRSLIKNKERGAFTWSLDNSGHVVNILVE
ncbi:MAG: small ribosomal subunit Rsm22 family protein [Chthoniobacterales bacterium]